MIDAEIIKHRQQSHAISSLPSHSGDFFKGWLRVDARPVKQALSTWVTKWMFAYTSYLQSSVQDGLAELRSFMQAITNGVARDVDPADEAALVQVMTYIRDVRLRTHSIDSMFEP